MASGVAGGGYCHIHKEHCECDKDRVPKYKRKRRLLYWTPLLYITVSRLWYDEIWYEELIYVASSYALQVASNGVVSALPLRTGWWTRFLPVVSRRASMPTLQCIEPQTESTGIPAFWDRGRSSLRAGDPVHQLFVCGNSPACSHDGASFFGWCVHSQPLS